MTEGKRNAQLLKKIPWLTIGIVGLLFLFVLFMFKSGVNNNQAEMPMGENIYFKGEYSVGGGAFNEIKEGEHIPATRGDVTLRGHFYTLSQNTENSALVESGTPIAFFLDHVNVKVYESGRGEYELFGENSSSASSSCGEIWVQYVLQGDTGAPIEIVIHNPHSFGNETAVDDLLSGINVWSSTDFEGEVLSSGEFGIYLGVVLCISAILLLGVALFSTLIHIQKNALIWIFGFVTLFAGAHIIYSAPGLYFWSEQIALNTVITGVSMMYYMLFVSFGISLYADKTKKIGRIVSIVLGVANAVFILIPLVTSVRFYDTWAYWVVVQSAANVVLLCCLIKEFISADVKRRWGYLAMMLPLIAFEVDLIATRVGWWKGGAVSKCLFAVVFVSVVAIVLFIIPQNIKALGKAKEIELEKSRLEIERNAIAAELKESRIAIMLSQIRPHFIYNTLGTIERLCLKDPNMAFELVRNFSLYLRGNFSELDSVAPIRFSDEMKHVQYYVNIEKVRFPDMTIEYRDEFSDFALPALSVQPLVENAIKHGLMPLESGGRVVIRSYETKTHFCVEVADNGVGFDTNLLINKKEHVGLNNIRERLRTIVNGELIVESAVGSGTRATIMIPKE